MEIKRFSKTEPIDTEITLPAVSRETHKVLIYIEMANYNYLPNVLSLIPS